MNDSLGSALGRIADLSQALASTLDIERSLVETVRQACLALNAEAASLFLLDGDQEHLVCRACHGPVEVVGLRVAVSSSLVGRALRERTALIVENAHLSADFDDSSDKRCGFQTRSVVVAPLLGAEGPLGVLQVLNPRGRQSFVDEDAQLLRLLAAPAALAIANARLATALIEQQRLKREFQLARKMQRSLLPRRPQRGYPLLGINLPAREISGDFYDHFELPDGRIAFCAGDVSGKGMDAALLMVRASSALRFLGKDGLEPSRWLARANEELLETTERGMFVCAVVGTYDPSSGLVQWSSAGFPPALLASVDGQFCEFPADGPPLGILPDLTWTAQRLQLAGEALYFYSDGATDVRDHARQLLGINGLKDLLRRHGGESAESRLRSLVGALKRLTLADDTTFLLIEDALRAQVVVQIKVEACPTKLCVLRHSVDQALAKLGLGADERLRLVLAVDEAAANIIRHAYCGQAGDIALTLSAHPDRLEFRLRDWAPTASAQCLKQKSLSEVCPGGLGINLIDQVMDDWRIESVTSTAGNRMLMVRRLPVAAAATSTEGPTA